MSDIKVLEVDESIVEFREMVREYFLPEYDNNDAAHRIDHADAVADAALMLCDLFDNQQLNRSAIVAAYAHDMFCEFRDEHHNLAADWLLSNHEDLYFMCGLDVKMIAEAVRSHRASWTAGYDNPLAEYIACADRGEPDVKRSAYRSYLYAIDKLNSSTLDAPKHAVAHIKEKYGTGGYYNCPSMYGILYADKILELRAIADIITPELAYEFYLEYLNYNTQGEK